MKKWVVIGILLVFILSINFVSAESNEINETETTNEVEVEECATSISINFNQDAYREGDFFEVTIEIFDSSGNHLPNYNFYTQTYDNMWHSVDSQSTDVDGYFKYTGIAEKPAGGVTKTIFKVYTTEFGSCDIIEEVEEVGFIPEEEAESEPESTPVTEESEAVPTVCAAKIDVNFNKAVYAIGDDVKITIEIFDSAGNHIPNYAFYGQMYDDRWHTPDLQKTDNKGYFIHTGIAEKPAGGVTEVKFKVYTKEIGSCKSIEDTAEITLEISEPVPCGIGNCVPEEEEKEPEEIPDEKVFYICTGCELEDKCYPMGYRKKGRYCSENNEFIDQLQAEACDNNFECKSNFCVSGECISEGLMKKIINWFKKLFGAEPKPPELKQCSELLIEKNIGDYKYNQTLYGFKEAQVPVYSEDGEQKEIVKCCAVQYLYQDGKENMGMVCEFDSKEDVENSMSWILIKNTRLTLGEYKGENVLNDQDKVVAWTSNNYIIATGAKGEGIVLVEEDIAGAYLEKYPNDLEI
ncbi:hypothetical protein KAI04_04445 [Candidatus Pacearchaeota archaeon]|nr:hypothetical protein [Candidatus Pacearchaeota archaeon]